MRTGTFASDQALFFGVHIVNKCFAACSRSKLILKLTILTISAECVRNLCSSVKVISFRASN